MYLQDNKLFRFCQVGNEDIDMSYVALPYIYYILDIYTSLKQLNSILITYTHPLNNLPCDLYI